MFIQIKSTIYTRSNEDGYEHCKSLIDYNCENKLKCTNINVKNIEFRSGVTAIAWNDEKNIIFCILSVHSAYMIYFNKISSNT